MLPHILNQLHTLQAVVIFARGVAAVVAEHAPDARLGRVLVGAGDEARVRSDLGRRGGRVAGAAAVGRCRRRGSRMCHGCVFCCEKGGIGLEACSVLLAGRVGWPQP